MPIAKRDVLTHRPPSMQANAEATDLDRPQLTSWERRTVRFQRPADYAPASGAVWMPSGSRQRMGSSLEPNVEMLPSGAVRIRRTSPKRVPLLFPVGASFGSNARTALMGVTGAPVRSSRSCCPSPSAVPETIPETEIRPAVHAYPLRPPTASSCRRGHRSCRGSRPRPPEQQRRRHRWPRRSRRDLWMRANARAPKMRTAYATVNPD